MKRWRDGDWLDHFALVVAVVMLATILLLAVAVSCNGDRGEYVPPTRGRVHAMSEQPNQPQPGQPQPDPNETPDQRQERERREREAQQ